MTKQKLNALSKSTFLNRQKVTSARHCLVCTIEPLHDILNLKSSFCSVFDARSFGILHKKFGRSTVGLGGSISYMKSLMIFLMDFDDYSKLLQGELFTKTIPDSKTWHLVVSNVADTDGHVKSKN